MRWALWRGTLLYEIIVPVTQPLYMLEDVIIHWLISCVRQDVPVDIYFNAVIISQKIYLLIISEIWCLGLTFSESKLYLILRQASFDIEACHSDSTKMNSHAVFKYVSNLQTILKAWRLVQLSVFPLWCISFPQNISQFTENWQIFWCSINHFFQNTKQSLVPACCLSYDSNWRFLDFGLLVRQNKLFEVST